MAETRKIVDRILGDGLAVTLRSRGYRKRGLAFANGDAHVIRIVSAQTQTYPGSDGSTVTNFTINLGVWFRDLGAVPNRAQLGVLFRDLEEGQWPSESECLARERLGMLAYGHDTWWYPKTGEDNSVIAKQVAQAWETHGARWMDTFASPSDAIDQFEKDGNYFAAGLLSLGLGDRPRATTFMRSYISKITKPARLDRVTAWCEDSGLRI